MLIKAIGIIAGVLANITSGCGLAIHKKWVGEMEPTPHIVLGSLVVIFLIAELILIFILI